MEKSINIKIEELKNQLYSVINNSGLPLASVYYLFKDFMIELTEFYNKSVGEEIQKYQEELAKEQEQKDTTNKEENQEVEK